MPDSSGLHIMENAGGTDIPDRLLAAFPVAFARRIAAIAVNRLLPLHDISIPGGKAGAILKRTNQRIGYQAGKLLAEFHPVRQGGSAIGSFQANPANRHSQISSLIVNQPIGIKRFASLPQNDIAGGDNNPFLTIDFNTVCFKIHLIGHASGGQDGNPDQRQQERQRQEKQSGAESGHRNGTLAETKKLSLGLAFFPLCCKSDCTSILAGREIK